MTTTRTILLLSVMLFTAACASDDIYVIRDSAPMNTRRHSRLAELDVVLDKQAVLLISQRETPTDAIQQLDSRPFDFELNVQSIEWFSKRGVHRDVLDYLHKRSLINWEDLQNSDAAEAEDDFEPEELEQALVLEQQTAPESQSVILYRSRHRRPVIYVAPTTTRVYTSRGYYCRPRSRVQVQIGSRSVLYGRRPNYGYSRGRGPCYRRR